MSASSFAINANSRTLCDNRRSMDRSSSIISSMVMRSPVSARDLRETEKACVERRAYLFVSGVWLLPRFGASASAADVVDDRHRRRRRAGIGDDLARAGIRSGNNADLEISHTRSQAA